MGLRRFSTSVLLLDLFLPKRLFRLALLRFTALFGRRGLGLATFLLRFRGAWLVCGFLLLLLSYAVGDFTGRGLGLLSFVELVTSDGSNLPGRRRRRLISGWCLSAEPTLGLGIEIVLVGISDYVLADPGILLLVGEFPARGTFAVDEAGRGRQGF